MDLSIILPAWNEAGNLPPLIKELRHALEGVTSSYEIVVIDGGSRDGTAEVARSLGCDVILQKTPGYGGALREGFAAAKGAYLCTLDADLSHPPTFISEMWRRREEAEMVIASRYVPGGSADMPRSRLILSKILNRTFSELLSIPVGDLSSGYRLYRREALRAFDTKARNFNICQELITGILARGGRVIEVPFHYRPRIYGVSHARIIRFGLSYLQSLWHLFFLRTALFRGDVATRLVPYFLLIALAIAGAYSNTLRAGSVHWDDDYLVFQNPALRSIDAPSLGRMFDPTGPREAYGSQYEPLADLSYAIDGQLFGWHDPRYFHLQGVLWHAIASCLLFVLLNRHTGNASVALVAALLFALHPAATEAVTWISGRRTCISAALVLAAGVAWLRFRRSGGAMPYLASLGLIALACLAKQSAIAAPLVLALLDVTARARPARRGGLIPHLALAAGFTALFLAIGRREGVIGPSPLGLGGHIQSGLIALAYYARLSVLPLWLRPIYDLLFPSSTIFLATLAAGALAGAAWLGGAFALRRRSPAAAFGLAASFVTLAPALAGLGPHAVAERYLYLPLAFLAALPAAAFAHLARVGPPPSDLAAEHDLARRRRRLTAALGIVLVVLGTATHLRNRAWRNDVALWSNAARKDPLNRVVHRELGEALLRSPGLQARALPLSFGVLSLRPSPERLVAADAELRTAADLLERFGGPTRGQGPAPLPAILGEIALIAELRGDPAAAEAALTHGASVAPDSEAAWLELGDFYLRHGDFARARAVYLAFTGTHAGAGAIRDRLRAIGP